MSQDKKKQAEALFMQGVTISDIARKLDVARRTIQRWKDEGDWEGIKDALPTTTKVISIASKPKPVNTDSTPHRNPPSLRVKADSKDSLSIAEEVIQDLQSELIGVGDTPLNGRDRAALANCLKAWVEYRDKLQPKTAADLAEMAIGLGINPAEFMTALKEQWAKRA